MPRASGNGVPFRSPELSYRSLPGGGGNPATDTIGFGRNGRADGGLMTLDTGSYRLGPQAGRLLLMTGRTGLGRRAGHDLTIEATRWLADVVLNSAEPGQ